MTEKRVQFNNIVQNQLPQYVREEFPLITEFLKQYYISQEFQGAPVDLAQNIDKYIKLNETTNLVDSVVLGSDISFVDDTISVDLSKSPSGTQGFPDSYGLLKIDNEIITYTGKTSSSFTGCIRGFSGVTGYTSNNSSDELVFSTSESEEHTSGSEILNLSNLFLKEFLSKTKSQFLPEIDKRELASKLNQNLFIKQSKDFYLSRGTDRSFEILFKALYDENVKVVKPSEYLLKPSNADFRVVQELVVESISGDPLQLENSVLYQDEYGEIYPNSYAPITSVEKIVSEIGQTYYKISYDAGYNRDLRVEGSLYGEFSIHPKTRVIGNVSTGSTIIDVDSTIGFLKSGELSVKYNDGSSGIVSYTSKSLTQFFGCSNISGLILDAESVGINTYAYGQYVTESGNTETVRVRINSVLSELEYPDNTHYYLPNSTIIIKTLGCSAKDFVSKNWFYNIASTYEVKNISLVDSSNGTYSILLNVEHYFKKGDDIFIIGTDGVNKSSIVIDIPSENSITIKGQGELNLNDKYTVQRNILKGKSNTFPQISNYHTNVQNVYTDSTDTELKASKVLVSSNSIPYYDGQPLDSTDRSITFSGTFSGSQFTISTKDHNFYTGDSIYYIPEKTTEQIIDDEGNTIENEVIDSSLFAEGIYFVKRINSTTISLSKSRDDISNSNFISLENEITVSNNIIQPYENYSKLLSPQKILREISEPVIDGNTYETESGFTGILVNGVEILNYKSKDFVYYGKLDNVEVLSQGSNYDVINPPTLEISDTTGIGATGYVSVSGSLSDIRILDSGFDYVETPTISITGGNGSGAVASVNMKLIEHKASFFADSASKQVSLGSTSSTIGFGTYHKFRNAERVIYNPESQLSVGGISTNSEYYISIVDSTTIKLHKTQSDAILGINTVVLSSFGVGRQEFKSFTKKSVVGSINVISPGSNYENKIRTAKSSGISTSLNQISIQNHDYKSGDIIEYVSFTETSVGGLSTGTQYYVTKIDNDNFKLSIVGPSDNNDFYYNTKQYVNINSVGVGTHLFNYPEISIRLIGKIGISSVGTETFEASLQPVFRGSITSIHLSNNGVGYGSSVINFERDPSINLRTGQDAQVLPIISDGRLQEVLILNGGKWYNSPPDLILEGDGVGAIITPIVSNGVLTEVKVIESGIGYSQELTSITVISPGSPANFKSKIQSWRVNLFEKYFNTFTGDDGFIHTSLDKKTLQYSHIYAPRKLRESLFSRDQTGKVLYGKKDLNIVVGSEVSSNNHSPIIGWSYDGHPIYGPYGYILKSGGTVTQLKSGYIKKSTRDYGPSISDYPLGFFVEDYEYKRTSDDTVLDENNGRFCVTPEFPNGTYAYFSTFETLSVDSTPTFFGYKRPKFPYLIGKSFKGIPNSFNFKSNSNQDDFNLNNNNWFRNTDPYNLINGKVNYKYLNIPNKLDQKSEILATLPGSIDTIGIETGGFNYKINDSIVFDNEGTNGYNARAKVSRLLGKNVNNISVSTSSISGVEIIPSDDNGNYTVICNDPHNFKNVDIVTITGLSTTSSKIEGSYKIGIGNSNVFSLVGSGISDSTVTGIVTYFDVSGRFGDVRENDILSIGTEKVKVLNIQPTLSRIRVLREFDGTIGSAHTANTFLYNNHRRFNINAGFKTTYAYKENREIYFNPSETVGVGTSFGVGVGYTISLSNPGVGITQIYIPTKSVYIKNHNLNTGDQLTYFTNDGTGISFIESDVGIAKTLSNEQSLFVAKISEDLIGLSTVRVGLDTSGTFVGIASTVRSSTTIFFTGIGTGTYHSFKTNYENITGEVLKNTVTVSTAETHGLSNNDIVYVDVNPSISTSYAIKYNDYTRRLIFNPQEFSAIGVNTDSNIITINNHRFKTGQKVLHTSDYPSEGLFDNSIYYIVKVDENNFKLSNSYYNSTQLKPSIVGISSASIGTISLINPPINAYRNSTILFDLSDSSLSYTNQSTQYPAFEFDFYIDEDFTQKYEKNIENSVFNVQRTGTVGISSDAKATLIVDEKTPNTLYYKLSPIFNSDLPDVKKEVAIDNEPTFNNAILVNYSNYNGKHKVTTNSNTSFTYTLSVSPENSSYISSTSSLKYETDSLNAYGSISKINILDTGINYYSLPGISTITTNSGYGAIINVSSENIGRIKKTKIKDIGFDFSSDNTVRPCTSLPIIAKIEPFSSFESIGVTSFGKGYTSAPKLLVFDGKTNELIDDVDLRYTLGSSKVEIIKNTYGINDTIPTIIPTQNTNGVGIGSISYNSSTGDVTVIMSVGFSTSDSFPFTVNDKVLIENISIGVGSTGRGFDSKNYNYKLFTLTDVDSNIGGIGSVTYNIADLVQPGEFIGNFDPINSSGRIIAEKDFPIFNPLLKSNNYFEGEYVSSTSSTFVGVVDEWDSKNKLLKISSNQIIQDGEVLKGESSNIRGILTSKVKFNSQYKLNSSSRVEKGWQLISGFLNDNLQRIQDSFYYQNFSYSLKSKVDFDTWKDVVGSLNHTLGFKKFSDYQLESSLEDANRNSLVVGISTNIGYFEIIRDLTESVDLNCVNDFDLVRENSIVSTSGIISDEIIFSNRVLTDYEESFGNRVLSIDDVSSQFNSNPRSTSFSVVNTFDLSKVRAQKYLTFVSDKRFEAQRQLLLVDLIHDGSFAYMNQYGRLETQYDQGSFDFSISGTEGQLLFYPTKYTVNDYNITCLSYNIDDNLLSVGSTSIGGIGLINTESINISSGISTTIVGIGSTYTTVKVLVEITPDINTNEFEFEELNIVHDGTNIELLEYGQLTTVSTVYASGGLGTYYPYFSGSELKIDFIPNSGVGIGTTGVINTIQIALSNSSYSGIGTVLMKHAKIEAKSTLIVGSGSPTENVVGEYDEEYDAAYFVVQVSDTTNNKYQMSEIIVVDDYLTSLGVGDTYDTEYGIIETSSGLGTFGTRVSIAGTVELLFTPNPSIDTQVKVYMNALRYQDDDKDTIEFNNGTIETNFSSYTGTERDIKRSFDLSHENYPIFERYFDGSDSNVVDTSNNTITIPNHFFVSGENIVYYHAGVGSTQAIGIATTTMSGVGSTDKVPSGITTSIYAVKVDENKIKLASSAENALKTVPETLDITSVGIGTSHRFVSTNQNAKLIVALDNIIQSPIVSTAVTTTLADQVFTTDDIIKFTGITSFFGSDLIKIGSEIMKIEGVGIGSTNTIRVRRQWLGTNIAGYSTGDLVTKVNGNYNIIDNIITFAEAPYGNTPIGTSTNSPDERDWSGITTSSSFQGRSFMRSGVLNTSNETYYKNYIFDDISSNFDGSSKVFTLKSNNNNISGISTENAVILVNDIFQSPISNYTLSENTGITSISFVGSATSITNDVNTSSLPIGGIIVSVGSSEGFGYQPLVSAGGTVIVSSGGTIQSISIGNTGSGYRASENYEILTKTSASVGVGSTEIYLENSNSVFDLLNLLNTGSNCTIGIGSFIKETNIISVGSTHISIGIGSTSSYEIPEETSISINISNPQIGIVNVGVANSTVGIITNTHVGFATIIFGSISSTVTITNGGIGYTSTNPPYVIIDDPESYYNVPLVYSSSSSGFGTGARIDIVVGQGSSVIDFEISNTGYGYGQGEILTIPTGGLTGIPTTSGFSEFQVSIQKTFTDEFTGWSIGELEVLDNFDNLFDGETTTFQLKKNQVIKSILASKGSNIVVQDLLLVFINDILQVPGKGYVFEGGSIITFTEPPKIGDTSKILFYRGSGSIDVISREIIETVKVGDELIIGYDSSIGQTSDLQENSRTVTSTNSTDLVSTVPYFGPGNTENESLLRPVVWCRQTEDKIINGKEVGKDRELYEPNINPFAYIIKNVGIGSTVIYVDNLRPFFDSQNESDTTLAFQNKVTIISQDEKSGAIGTAVVSGLGTISSVVISDGGVGYTTATVSFASTVGVATTSQAFGSVIIGSGGTVTGIAITSPGIGYTISNPPQVLISHPTSLTESNEVSSYSGDYGIIVGVGTTTQSSVNKIIFDLYIPQDSFLRDSTLVGSAVTLSSVESGDYFIVYNSIVGLATTSFTTKDIGDNVIGFATNFVNAVYQVDSVSTEQSNIPGIGLTSIRRIYSRISGIGTGYDNISISEYFGEYSWGKILLTSRSESNEFDSYRDLGVVGIKTSPIVSRFSPLRFKDYLV